MFDFFVKIGEIISNIFRFFWAGINAIFGFAEALFSWWDSAMTILSAFPPSIVAILLAAFGLLLGFIFFELLRDLL